MYGGFALFLHPLLLKAKEFASVAVGLFIEHERRIKSLLCHCLVS